LPVAEGKNDCIGKRYFRGAGCHGFFSRKQYFYQQVMRQLDQKDQIDYPVNTGIIYLCLAELSGGRPIGRSIEYSGTGVCPAGQT